MKRLACVFVSGLALVGALVVGLGAARADRVTVDQMVERALAANTALASAHARAEAGHAQAKSAWGRLLPEVRVSDEYLHYDSPFAIMFGSMAFRVRDQDTNSFTASFGQPLLGLLARSEEFRAAKATALAGDAQTGVTEAQVREAVESEYLRMFEALALEEIARSSERELGEQVTIAEARVKAGVITTADLLRVRVAAANARQQAIVARTQASISRATLLAAVGLATDAPLDFAEPSSLLDGGGAGAAALSPQGPLEAHALAKRFELKQLELGAAAALHHERAALFALLPELDAEGGYIRLDGQVFAPANQEFIGVRASWAVWDWGVRWHARQAARAQADAAAIEIEGGRRQVRVEVASRRAVVESAVSAVEVARETIASAEEAYRITEAQVKAGTATTTDLLDAQSALTQARLNLTRARYQEAMARVSLKRALGD
jgi:outer membrane protein TolC